jgi:hypothetical protein
MEGSVLEHEPMFRWFRWQKVNSKSQHHSDTYRLTTSGPCIKVTVSLWAKHFPFVAYDMWMSTRLYYRSVHKCCSRTDRRYDRSPVHTAVGRTEHCCDSSLVVTLQLSVVLWLKGIATNWLQMFKINLLPKWSGRRIILTVFTADQSNRFLWNFCKYLPTSESVGRR